VDERETRTRKRRIQEREGGATRDVRERRILKDDKTK
jgi:hypothetical protein